MIDTNINIGLVAMANPMKRPSAGVIIQDDFDLDSPWHHHDMHQLHYAFEGSMELQDREGRHLLPRSLAGWIPAGVTHRNGMHRIRSISVLLPKNSVPSAGTGVRILNVTPLMREMMTEAARWPIEHPIDDTGRAFFHAFALLCAAWIENRSPLTLPTTEDAVLDMALAPVRSDPAGIEMAAALSAAGLSERSLRRRCHAQLGMGWDEYRRRARLLASIDMLTESRLSIAQVAAEVGFESQSAYARAFRHLTGQAPTEFRVRLSSTLSNVASVPSVTNSDVSRPSMS